MGASKSVLCYKKEWPTSIQSIRVGTSVSSLVVNKGTTNSVSVELDADICTHRYVQDVLDAGGSNVDLVLDHPRIKYASITVTTVEDGCQIFFHSTWGGLHVSSIRGGFVTAESSSGNLTFELCACPIDASTNNGNLVFNWCSDNNKATSRSGNIFFNGCTGHLAATTTTGRLHAFGCTNAVKLLDQLEVNHQYDLLLSED